MCLGGFEELQTYCRSQRNPPVQYVPADRGNMAAVTNKESHMPLSSFMFKYKHRLWCISARYFQLSRVNLYLFTFTAGLMPSPFSYFKRRCTSEAKEAEKITTVSSNFYVGVLDSASLGVCGVRAAELFNNAFSRAGIVNKNKGSQEMFVLKKSCSPNRSFISNTGIISADKRLIGFADTDKIQCSHSGDGICFTV